MRLDMLGGRGVCVPEGGFGRYGLGVWVPRPFCMFLLLPWCLVWRRLGVVTTIEVSRSRRWSRVLKMMVSGP